MFENTKHNRFEVEKKYVRLFIREIQDMNFYLSSCIYTCIYILYIMSKGSETNYNTIDTFV